jgi:hypothetical protein
VLVLLMRGVYDVSHCDGHSWHDITSNMKTATGFRVILMLGLRNLSGCNVGIADMGDL